jgi:flavin reductase (DIM6/NTAB) family NADH-FMN oxidoreductase RutF
MIDGALVWLACELRDVHDGGDHAIATGRVLELEAGDGDPLVFIDGDYRPLG